MPSQPPLPTPAELELLRVLWGRGASTVREVHDEQQRRRPVRYTTVLRLLQNLHDKGLVRRDNAHRSHVFESAVEQDGIERALVDKFVDTVFDGAAGRMVLRAVSGHRASKAELEELRRLATRMDREESDERRPPIARMFLPAP
jgi:predicted transcriptional regulator